MFRFYICPIYFWTISDNEGNPIQTLSFVQSVDLWYKGWSGRNYAKLHSVPCLRGRAQLHSGLQSARKQGWLLWTTPKHLYITRKFRAITRSHISQHVYLIQTKAAVFTSNHYCRKYCLRLISLTSKLGYAMAPLGTMEF